MKKIWTNCYEIEGSRSIREVVEHNVMGRCYMDKYFMYQVSRLPLYGNYYFEFSKSESGFIISIPENPHLQTSIKIGNFRNFSRHIGSTTFNFENLTAYLKLVIKTPSVYKFSWKINNFQNYGPLYWNRHCGLSKSDRGFVISISENSHL